MENSPPQHQPTHVIDLTISTPIVSATADQPVRAVTDPRASGPNANQQSLAVTGNEIPEIRTIEDFDRFVCGLRPGTLAAAVRCINFMKDQASKSSTGTPTPDDLRKVINLGIRPISKIAQDLYYRRENEQLASLRSHLLAMATQERAFCMALKIAFDTLPKKETEGISIRLELKKVCSFHGIK